MNSEVRTRKKLIEVALPLEAINKAAAREKSIRHGHPSTLHLWWARRPLAAARAVIFSQMVDDPSSVPELFPTKDAQEKERQRLFKLIEELVQWENTTNEKVLSLAREEIWKSWRRACTDNKDHPRAKELFDPDKLPAFHDPFAGGGSLPLEAQRLGLEAYASDLNPVAVLINKAMIEIPPKFAGVPPVNPESRRNNDLFKKKWRGAEGLAEDVRYYGKWMRDEAERRIRSFYQKVEITPEMTKVRSDLKPLIGEKLTVIAWLWARTVNSPDPAYAQIPVPLASSFLLCTKPGRESYVVPVIGRDGYSFSVKVGKPPASAEEGTKLGRGNFRCLMSGTPVPVDYIKAEGQARRIGSRLMAVIAEGISGRVYLSPDKEMEQLANSVPSMWYPTGEIPAKLTGGTCVPYGFREWGDLFTARQFAALTTFSDVAAEAPAVVRAEAIRSGYSEDQSSSYATAIATYLAFLVSQVANHSASLCGWNSANSQMRSVFARQAIPMVWDYAESNPFSDSSGSFNNLFERMIKGFSALGSGQNGYTYLADAATQTISKEKVISTDPPYYDNIAYADLSDFFYVWLRRTLKSSLPEVFTTLAVPKNEELVATAYRHGGKEKAEEFFLNGMTQAMRALANNAHAAFPVSVYYAFKQSETQTGATASTGWETFLQAIITAGFELRGTWPMRTEKEGRVVGIESNALASSIILVCRPRSTDAPMATRREFISALKQELPISLAYLQRGNIAPVDLEQAVIGPGMGVYTRFSKVVDAEGKMLTVRDALSIINQTKDDALAGQEGDFDSDTRWALTWFDDAGFSEGAFGIAEQLSKSKNTSVEGMVAAKIVVSRGGKVRLLRPDELAADWNPLEDSRLTVWEALHQLIRRLEKDGEAAAAELVAVLGGVGEVARELAYRLYVICERKKRAQEALSYNALVQSWPEITKLARERSIPRATQAAMFS